MSEYTGKRYLVTGTASGIGQSVAAKLNAAGAQVVSLDRNEPSVPVTEHHKVDLASRASIDAVLGEIEGTFDGLLNIAGVPGTAPAETVFAVNSLAVRHLAEEFFEVHVTPLRAGRRGTGNAACCGTRSPAWWTGRSAAPTAQRR